MIFSLNQLTPTLAERVWVAPDAQIIGDVHLAPEVSIWFGAILRADNDRIEIGQGSNVQDGVVIHTDPGFPCSVGADSVIGHRAVLHGCSVGTGALIGIAAVVLNGAVIGDGCLLGAGSLVPEGKVLEPNCLYFGAPARKIRPLTALERDGIRRNAQGYRERAARYRAGLRPVQPPRP